MLFRVIITVLALMCVQLSTAKAADVNERLNYEEGDFVLAAGGIADGEFIWIVPSAANSFAKINIQTGEQEDLSVYDTFDELNRLEGYKTGAYYENEHGRFIYLAPYMPNKPLVKINIDNMDIDYPIINPGYYYGLSDITSENGNDFLWLFPGEIKPDGSSTLNEITKINLNNDKIDMITLAEINGQPLSFSDIELVDDKFWMVPKHKEGIVTLDINAGKLSLLNNRYEVSRLSTISFDGSYIWLTGENLSYSINESVLLKCDEKGGVLLERRLTKDRYVKSFVHNGSLYLFAGSDVMKPKCFELNTTSDELREIKITGRKGYIPSYAMKNGDNILIVPDTADGVKMPVVKVTQHSYETIKGITLVEKDNENCILLAEIALNGDEKNMVAMGLADIENLYEQITIIKNINGIEDKEEYYDEINVYEGNSYLSLLLSDGGGAMLKTEEELEGY